MQRRRDTPESCRARSPALHKFGRLFMLFMQLARLTLVYPYDSNMAVGTNQPVAGSLSRPSRWSNRRKKRFMCAKTARFSLAMVRVCLVFHLAGRMRKWDVAALAS